MRENLLIDSLPETVEVNGREFPINSDFRTGILFEMLIYDNSISNQQKCNQIYDLYFDRNAKSVPRTGEAIDAVLAFYRCGKQAKKTAKSEEKEADEQGGVSQPKQIYDYEYDDLYIYAAFLSQYGIDLNEIEYLHWWKFKALFDSLNKEQKIVEIMGYRAADLSKIKDKAERSRIARLKALYALPNNATTEEKAAHAAMLFSGGIST